MTYRIRVRRALRRLEPARGRAPAAVERLGSLAARAPGLGARLGRGADRDALAGRAAVGAAIGAMALATSTHGGRAIAALPLGAWLGWRGGIAWHERGRLAAQAEARRALPWVLDRLSTCVLAGMSVEHGLRAVAPGAPGLLGEAIADGLRALTLGVPRARAYERIAARSGLEEVRALMGSLARADRFGSSVADTLLAQARELRSRARAAAEAEARTAPVKLLFPLVFCFLPAFVLLTIAPIALSAVRTLGDI